MATVLEKYTAELLRLDALQDKEYRGSIRWYIRWYEERYPSRRWLYRGTGVLVLVSGLFSGITLQNRSVGSFELMGFLVAFIVGLNAFFSAGTAWRTYFLAKVRLEFLLTIWEAKLGEARITPDENKALVIVSTACEDLLRKAELAIEEEAKGFFDSLKFPGGNLK
jgi:hypothetical protein